MGWSIFFIVISVLLIFDLGFAHQKNGVMSFRQSVLFSIFYFLIACIFGFYIFYNMGGESAREYFTCFLVEKAMSLDNIFIISLIFQFFQIPSQYQHKILFLGIIGVIVFRAIMIYCGILVITKFSWILYIFAIILVVTGVKTFYLSKKEFNIKNSSIYKILQKYLNITSKIESNKFVVRINNKFYITPLFVSLILIETIDVVFAIDSIPAIFAITNDAYIIYTSNIFAILGLRSLFFCLGGIVERFSYIKYSLALILIFIGLKIFAHHFIDIPTYVALVVTIGLLALGVIISILKQKNIS